MTQTPDTHMLQNRIVVTNKHLKKLYDIWCEWIANGVWPTDVRLQLLQWRHMVYFSDYVDVMDVTIMSATQQTTWRLLPQSRNYNINSQSIVVKYI